MHRRLLLTGGILNALLALFHVYLGYQIQLMPGVSEGVRALMQMLNVGGIITVALLAAGSLACPDDMLGSRLGRLFSAAAVLYYASRAVEEVILSPRFSPAIFVVCLFVAAIYLVMLVAPYPGGRQARETQAV